MKEEENVVAYPLQLDEVVNTIKGLHEKIEESMIVKKVLRSLPSKFNAKESSLEELKDLDILKMD